MPSVGVMRGRGGGDVEDLVGERLRSILAAATPRAGWVPDRMGESSKSADQPRMEEPDRTATPEQLPEPDKPDKPDRPNELERRDQPHRGSAGARARIRWEPGRPGALAMCLVAVLAAVLSAGLTWWFRPVPSPSDAAALVPSAGTAPLGTGAGAAADGAGAADATGSGGDSADEQLVVSVIGQVHQPGLVTVQNGSRVADAIAAAGGALDEADLSTVNLARLVVDGEQIAVGIAGSSLPGGDSSSGQGLVNLNTASLAELEDLPGIGPVLAQRIIDFREENGGFDAVEQLREVSGIGPTLYEGIVDLVTV